MEDDALGFDLSVLDIDLVATQYDGNVLTHTDQVTVPVGDVLVGHSGGHVEHDDGTLSCGAGQRGIKRCSKIPHKHEIRVTVVVPF